MRFTQRLPGVLLLSISINTLGASAEDLERSQPPPEPSRNVFRAHLEGVYLLSLGIGLGQRL